MYYSENMEIIGALCCLFIYPLFLLIMYKAIRYQIYKEDIKFSFYCLLMPISLLIPTDITEYSYLINFIKTINPYMLKLFALLYIVVLIKFIYLKIKNKSRE